MSDSKYPTPNRSSFKPNQFKDDPQLPEGDIGSCGGVLADGRPFVMESWFSEGYTLISLFFSVLDLENAKPEQLLHLVQDVLQEAEVSTERRKLSAEEVRKITDSAGQPMYSLTFVVGEPDL